MSAERFTLDTNILIYAIDAHAGAKQSLAIQILRASVTRDCPLALQVVGEFFAASTAKLKLDPKDAGTRARQLLVSFETFGYSARAMRAATEEAARGRFSLWDGVLLASAAEAGCTTILSEDMAHGARFGSIAVLNPFTRNGLSPEAAEILGM